MIEIRNINKSYGAVKVLDDISTTIPAHQVTSIIGPNGAGKSTLLSIVGRLQDADSGTVVVDGLPVHTTPSRELAKRLSVLRQENFLSVRLTVRELVAFGRFPYSGGRLTPEDEVHINSAIEYLELTNLSHRYLDQLSGGQRQRAYIAMVLCQDTDYVLLDEPLNNLDMRHSASMMRLFKQLTNELGKTVVLVVHDINFASFHSQNIIAMKDGRIISEGTPNQIICSKSLAEVFDMHIDVHEIDGKLVGVYFD